MQFAITGLLVCSCYFSVAGLLLLHFALTGLLLALNAATDWFVLAIFLLLVCCCFMLPLLVRCCWCLTGAPPQ